MCFVKAFQSFRCCNDAHKFDIFSTLFLNEIDRCFCGTAGCKHRVNNHCDTLINGFRKFTVVFVWFVCYRITVKSYVSDFRRRNQCENTVYHSKTCTENRNNCQFLSCDHRCHTGFNRSFYFYILYRKITKSFVSHKDSNFFYQFTEFICSCILVSQHGDFVLDQRMIHDINVFHYRFPLLVVLLLFCCYCYLSCCTKKSTGQLSLPAKAKTPEPSLYSAITVHFPQTQGHYVSFLFPL